MEIYTIIPLVVGLLTMIFIFGIVFLIRKNQNNNELKELEHLRSIHPEDENNYQSMANRKFQNINPIGAKITWTFNEDGSKVQVKGGMMGLNTINSTITIQSLGYGKFKGSNGSVFTLEGNRIKSGPVYLNEVF
jgi:rRNA pseudouridine-1189 N-methylase Emg1 (Nep1/Mra1 family)